MRPRLPSPVVTAIAVLTLVLASGGVGYAAAQIGSAQIKDNSIQSVDVKNRTLTSADVKKKSLKREVLDRSCRAGEVVAFGGCVRKASTGPSTFQAAMDDCTERGGRILTLSELRWVGAHSGQYDWADGNPVQYEFSSDYTTSSPATPTALDRSGNLIDDASANSFWHHCLSY